MGVKHVLVEKHCVSLMLLRGGVGGQQILVFGQAPNGESNNVNHTEPEFLLQGFNEMQVRVREANGRRLEFVVLHGVVILASERLGCRCLNCKFSRIFAWHKIQRGSLETAKRYL